jgi:hypothetical protein
MRFPPFARSVDFIGDLILAGQARRRIPDALPALGQCRWRFLSLIRMNDPSL